MDQGRPLDTRERASLYDRPYRTPGVVLSLCSIVLALAGICFAIFSWHGPLWLLFSIVVGLFGTRMFVLWLGANLPSEKNMVTAGTPWVRLIPEGDGRQALLPTVRPQSVRPRDIPSSAATLSAIIPQPLNPPDYAQRALSPAMYGGYNPQIATTIAMNVPVDEDPLFQ
ncbi:MAG TPA: hypothetical protein VF043_36375, partial [Ktedonobacteraceae bacterium]